MHPDFTLIRLNRIKNLEKGLEQAEYNGNYNAKRFFIKEIEIQKAYLLIEAA